MEPTSDKFLDLPRKEQVRYHFLSTHENVCTNDLIPCPTRVTSSGKALASLVVSSEMNSGELDEILTAVTSEQTFLEEDFFISFYTKLESGGFANLPFYKHWVQSIDKISKYLKDNQIIGFDFCNVVGFSVLGQAVESGLLTEEIDPNHDYLYRVRKSSPPELPPIEIYSSDNL